jgi:hypothetical protein
MPLSDTEVLVNLQGLLARPDFFQDLNEFSSETPFTAPVVSDVMLGRLERSSLTVRQSSGDVTLTMNQVEAGGGTFKDVGIALPNSYFYVSHQPMPAGSGRFPVFLLDMRDGTVRFLPVGVDVRVASMSISELAAFVENRGLLFYNNTERPEPLFGILSYEIEEWKSYEILFIDLCADFARNALSTSRAELVAIIEAAQTQNATFQAMVTKLRTKARVYYQLEELRDFFNLLTYLRYLGPTSFVMSLAAEKQGVYRDLVDRTIPEMEQALANAGHNVTLEKLVEQMDGMLRKIRAGAPLLGRLSWRQVRNRTDAQIAQAVEEAVGDLITDNDSAREMLEEDMQHIRRLLTIIPPRVMSVQRITGTIERLHRREIRSDPQYFLSVERLKSQAATFQLMLGLASLVFAFFCPPVSVALGIFSAVISVQEAVFKDALSDSDVNVDQTFVTQAEAREAWFWAGVDVVFAAVDVIGAPLQAAKSSVRSLDMASDLSALPRSADDLAALGAEAAQDARALDRLAEAADGDALARATADVDVAAARSDLAQDLGQVDVSRSRMLSDVPTNAEDAIAQASPTVRQSIDQDLLPLVDASYRRHFDELVQRGQRPLSWDAFASDWYQIRVREIPVKQVDAPARDGFYRALAGPEGRVGDMLNTPSDLRQALVGRIQSGGIPTAALTGFDARFLDEFQRAVKRGASTTELDEIINQRFLGPIDDAARKAGFPAGQGREFGLFANGIGNVGTWADTAFPALRRLFEDAGIDNAALHAIMNNRAYTRFRGTSRLNMELAVALDRIKGVDGVMNRVSATNPRLFDSLVEGNRGHAFEALLVSRLLDDATREGARITVGRRWWLQSIDRVNAAEATNFTNVLEADILVELRDGRRILIDAKFFEKGLAVTETLDSQLAKIADGINERLIHNGEYWVSHHFAQSQEGLTNLDAFQVAADLYSSWRIGVVFDVFENGFPANFFDRSRFLQVSRGDAVIQVPPPPELRIPAGVAGPSPIPSTAVTRSPNAIVPEGESIVTLEAAIRQSQVIRSETTVSRNMRRSYVPINPIASLGRVTLVGAPVDTGATTRVRDFAFVRALGSTEIGMRRARDFAVGPLSDQAREQVRAAITERDEEGQPKFHLAPSMTIGGTARDLHVIAFHLNEATPSGARYQVTAHTEVGRLAETFPDDPAGAPLLEGWNVVPLVMHVVDGHTIHPLLPGSYILGLRLKLDGRFVTYPGTVAMRVVRSG